MDYENDAQDFITVYISPCCIATMIIVLHNCNCLSGELAILDDDRRDHHK